MIKFNNIEVFGIEGAIRGMRYPFKSTSKSDSWMCINHKVKNQELCSTCPHFKMNIYDNKEPEYETYLECLNTSSKPEFIIGEKDLNLAKKLSTAGTDHGKFLRMIHVQVDITAPFYWWKELDTYKVGTVANSESTMHTLLKYPIDETNFSDDALLKIPMLQSCFEDLLNAIEAVRVDGGDWRYNKEDIFKAIVQILPMGYNQTRTWDANYAVLKNIYHSRKNHKLEEWHEFCKWISSLPYSELIIGETE